MILYGNDHESRQASLEIKLCPPSFLFRPGVSAQRALRPARGQRTAGTAAGHAAKPNQLACRRDSRLNQSRSSPGSRYSTSDP
jgi:hypothetical protein